MSVKYDEVLKAKAKAERLHRAAVAADASGGPSDALWREYEDKNSHYLVLLDAHTDQQRLPF